MQHASGEYADNRRTALAAEEAMSMTKIDGRFDVDRPQYIGGSNRSTRGRRRLAVLVASGFAAVVAFQVSLAIGAPWGAAAWGGTDGGRLSAELRAASSFAASFWLLAALVALARGGIAASPIPCSVSRPTMWALTALLAAGSILNAASQSRWERFGWTPFVMVLTVASLQLARSGRGESSRKR